MLLGHAEEFPNSWTLRAKKIVVLRKLCLRKQLMAGCDPLFLKPTDLLSFTSRWAVSWSLVLVLIHWFLSLTWWLMGNSSHEGTAQNGSLCSPSIPLSVCPSLLCLFLAATVSLGWVFTLFFQVLTPAYPQVQGCRERTQSTVDGWCRAGRVGCADSLPRACSLLHWLSCTRTSFSLSSGTVLSNRAIKMPADDIL